MIPTLKLDHISKVYNKQTVVDNLSLCLYQGEIFGFIGPNGSGKTTILKMICGLTGISTGHIFIDGYDIDKNFIKAVNNIGAVIEQPKFYTHLSGRKNLKILAKFYGKSAMLRIPNIIKLLKMEDYIDNKVKTYSLAMTQRLGFAQALLNKPKLLILDQPTFGLDTKGINEIRSIIQTLATKEKMTIIISSSNLAELETICHQVAIMRSGKLLTFADMKKIEQDIKSTNQMCLCVNYPNYAGKLVQEKYDITVKVAGNSIILPVSEKYVAQIVTYLTHKYIKVYKTKKINKSLDQIYYELINNKPSSSSLF